MKETLYLNNTRTHTLALKENSFRGWAIKRLSIGMSNPNKDKTARRKQSRSNKSPVRKVNVLNTLWKSKRGIVSQFTQEMLYTGNRKDCRYQAKQELALIRRPIFTLVGSTFEFTKRGLKFT